MCVCVLIDCVFWRPQLSCWCLILVSSLDRWLMLCYWLWNKGSLPCRTHTHTQTLVQLRRPVLPHSYSPALWQMGRYGHHLCGIFNTHYPIKLRWLCGLFLDPVQPLWKPDWEELKRKPYQTIRSNTKVQISWRLSAVRWSLVLLKCETISESVNRHNENRCLWVEQICFVQLNWTLSVFKII